MGLFDSIKKAIGGAASTAAQQAAMQAVQPAAAPPPPRAQQNPQQPAPSAAHNHDHSALDMAGFDPENDENGFFNAVLHMESEGEQGGTDASRAEIMARYGIRDRSHWQDVKAAVYHTLAHKHGSSDRAMQSEMNWRMGETQRRMQSKQAAKAASGELAPVEGISLEAWAAFNASIVGGANYEDLLKGAGVDKPRWDRVNAEWNARMARDTTFAIATIYGNAFQAASKGKYGDLAREANAARAANRELNMPPPMSEEAYAEILYEQAYAAKQGKDPVQALKSLGLTIVDWTDLSSYMGYHYHRTAMLHHEAYVAAYKRAEAKVAAKYPGVKADVDIAF
jgi:hypothetical protein